MTITRKLSMILMMVVAIMGWAATVGTPTASAQGQSWRGEYFPNTTLTGTPTVRDDSTINFNWGGSAPWAGFPADNFSVRWTRQVWFDAGKYRFTTTTDDGTRLFLDGALVIDQWKEQATTSHSANVQLAAGWYTVRMEYLEKGGGATAQLKWERTDVAPPVTITDWRGEYFTNRDLAGTPTLVRNDKEVKFDWAKGSPDRAIGNDNFSARWTRTLNFVGGRYQFHVKADDGVRLWVDDVLVIDAWGRATGNTITRDVRLTDGNHAIRLEYQEQTGDALVRLSWTGPIAPAGTGNILTCLPAGATNSWIKVYRLQTDGTWVDVNPRGWGPISADGSIKIDGLEVDYGRYGEAGHPYRVERWINGQLHDSVGATERGEPAFRIKAGEDMRTPWGC